MTKKIEDEKRQRKEYKHGVVTQKLMSFKIDNDLTEWLNSRGNKGRYLNNLIRQDMEK